MQKFEMGMYRCVVNLAGDPMQQVVRGDDNDHVTGPELVLLEFIHGTEDNLAVHNIERCSLEMRSLGEEFERLTLKYGRKVGKFFGKMPATLHPYLLHESDLPQSAVAPPPAPEPEQPPDEDPAPENPVDPDPEPVAPAPRNPTRPGKRV